MTKKRKNVGKLARMTRRFSKLFLLIFMFCSFTAMSAISQQGSKITISESKISLADLLWKIQNQTQYEFVFDDEDLEEFKKLNVSEEGSIDEVLNSILEDKGLTYSKKGKVFVIKKEDPKPAPKVEKREIKGKVVDEKGNPLPGVTVVVQGTMNGTATDFKGKYQIQVKPSDALRFTFVGYKDQIILVKGREKLDVKMTADAQNIEEVTVVAFGEQKKESVVSSITSIKTDQLKSSNADLTTSLAGAASGIIAVQNGGIPGAMTEEEMNTSFYIRGVTSFQTDANVDPLILLDGVEISKVDLARVNPEDIESFNILKDASATAMYGARGANGVIYVTTKKGVAGDVYVSAKYERVWSMPTSKIDIVDPITYMKKYNEAQTGRFPGSLPKYTDKRIELTQSKKYPDYVYPSVDWYKKLFKDYTVNNRFSLNARGGGNKIQYYVSLTHNSDKGMLKVDRLNQFNPNIKSNQTSARINLTVDMTKTAKLVVNTLFNYDKYNGPYTDVREAYYLAFQASPVDFAPTYPADDKHSWPHIRYGGAENAVNPYARIQKGYSTKTRYSSINRAEYIQNLNFIAKGLELRASVSLAQMGYAATFYETKEAYYSLGNYDPITGNHSLTALNQNTAGRLLKIDGGRSGKSILTNKEYQVQLMHNASWGNHKTTFTGVFQARESNDNVPKTVQHSLPQRNLMYSARASYGYKDRYFIEASGAYNGSERFAKKNKLGFFPSCGIAWIPSRENWMRSTSKWLDQLKFRLSYGKVGNDGIIKEPRFVYLESLAVHPTGMREGADDSQGGAKNYIINNYANKEVKWEISEQVNFGTEIKLFNMVDLNVDLYQEVRHNIYANRTVIPSTVGLHAKPLDNVGKVRARGVDITGKIQHAFKSDFWFILGGTFTYNKAVFKEIEEASNKPSYQRKVGREISQQYGYVAEGLFQDEAEIASSPVQGGDVMPGDIRYRDINGDNKIDVNDCVALGFPTLPRIIYGANLFVHYKGVEFSCAFQGAAQRSFWINPEKVSPFDDNRALLTAIAKDHWTPENRKTNPLWPRLSPNNITVHNPQEFYDNKQAKEKRKSSYFMRNGAFLRCKSIELAYNLPKKIISKYHLRSLRVFARANNPFIISKFDLWDVELGSNGFNYPIQKTYSVGASISF